MRTPALASRLVAEALGTFPRINMAKAPETVPPGPRFGLGRVRRQGLEPRTQ